MHWFGSGAAQGGLSMASVVAVAGCAPVGKTWGGQPRSFLVKGWCCLGAWLGPRSGGGAERAGNGGLGTRAGRLQSPFIGADRRERAGEGGAWAGAASARAIRAKAR